MIKDFQNSHLGIVKTLTLLKWASFPRSTYYYKRSEGKRERKTSHTTIIESGEVMDDSQVVEMIQDKLKGEFCCYGYKNTHSCLKELGYRINHMKVYRLLKVHKLVHGSKLGKTTGARTFVKYRRIEASRPYEYLCMNIK